MTHTVANKEIRGCLARGETWAKMVTLARRDDRLLFIREHRELLRLEVVSELTTLIPWLVKSELSEALPVAEIAVIIARRLRNMESLAQSFRAKANALYALGRCGRAINYHRKAIALFRSIDNREEVARTLSSAIQPLILQGHYGFALAAAREAQSIFERQGNHWRLARVTVNLGNIYDRQDRVAEALKCYQRAYGYLSSHAEKDVEGIGVVLHNIAVSHLRLNDHKRAMAAFQEARAFALEHRMQTIAGQVDYNVGRLHYLRGDYRRALSMLRDARDMCSACGDFYHVALCNLDLSEMYLELNMPTEAREAAEVAAEIFRKRGMRYERAKAIMNVAVAVGKAGTAGHSLQLFLQARRMFVSDDNRAFLPIIDLHRALVLVRIGRDAEARELGITAMASCKRLRLNTKAVECHLLLARLFLDSDPLVAKDYCRRALRWLERVDAPALRCHANTLMGQLQDDAGNEKLAYKYYKQSRRCLERLRSNIPGEELKIAFMKDRIRVYEALVAQCLRRGRRSNRTAEAFTYIQEAKSRSLVDLLATNRTASCLGHAANAARPEAIRVLREELNWCYRRIDLAQLGRASRRELISLQDEARDREHELVRLSREYSGNREGLPWGSATLAIEQVQEAIPVGTVILEYFLNRDSIAAVLLSDRSVEIVPLTGRPEITDLLDKLEFQLSKHRLGPKYATIFSGLLLKSTLGHLRGLYRALIEPIRRRLDAQHLVIAPYGLLHRLPFQALFNGQDYLGDEFTISYAPSASVYALCRSRSTIKTRRSLIVGMPDEAAPFVHEEVTAVAKCLPNAKMLCGADATVEKLREMGRDSQFIHVATHGHFRLDNPMFSRLRVGGSYLSLYDLIELELPAELITLSGCSTGLNVVAAGDEPIGLARGLIHAGAETALVTMWDVQDRSAAQLMTSFYRQLRAGRKKAEALQHAMQQVRLEYPHPYHWAPFNLVGKG
jgi:CHAT domain-containing protein/tetratricopeptide (TPR) repeat protein